MKSDFLGFLFTMTKIHIPRKYYIIAIASFLIITALGSTVFFFNNVAEKWYDPNELYQIPIGDRSLSDIEIDANLIYVTKLYEGFEIFNIEDPTNPTSVGNFTNSGQLNRGVFYLEDRIFLLASHSLLIVNVSDPSSPEALGTYTTYENVQNVYVIDDVAYLMTFNWFRVLNISNPASISLLFSLQMHFGDHDVFVRDNIAYVASNLDGLVIFNVTNPSQPQRITALRLYGEGFNYLETWTHAVRVDGSRLYIVDGVHGLVAFDITNISSPVKLFRYVSGPPPDHIAIQGNNVFYPNRQTGVEIVDVSDPENIELLGTTPSRYLTSGVVMNGNKW